MSQTYKKSESITFQIEDWNDVVNELIPYWNDHWQDTECDKSNMPLNINNDEYEALQNAGLLILTTVRNDGRLIGYHSSVVRPHLHSKDVLTAFTTSFFINRDDRIGWTGVKLFKFLEEKLKSLGIKKIYAATKSCADIGPIFERLGWTKDETIYSKFIG